MGQLPGGGARTGDRPWSLEGKRIETINLQDRIPPMDVGLAWRKSMEFSPAMEAFRGYFRQSCDLLNHAVTRIKPNFRAAN